MKESEINSSSAVTLREITESNLEPILWLKVEPDQERFVASNAVSIAQGNYSKLAWFRGIYADETPVGFVMLSIDEEKPEYYLWRFMIDHRFQKRGFGRKALQLVIDHIRFTTAAKEMSLGCVEGEGSADTFYESMGFAKTGEFEEGEAIMRLELG